MDEDKIQTGIIIRKDLLELFDAHCEKHGYNRSNRISVLIADDIQRKD